jgi:hypothetical protein
LRLVQTRDDARPGAQVVGGQQLEWLDFEQVLDEDELVLRHQQETAH